MFRRSELDSNNHLTSNFDHRCNEHDSNNYLIIIIPWML